MPNSYQYNILSISIFSKIPLLILIFSRISFIDIDIPKTGHINNNIDIDIFQIVPINVDIDIDIFKLFLFVFSICSIFSYRCYVDDDIYKTSVDISSVFQKMLIYRQPLSIFHHNT